MVFDFDKWYTANRDRWNQARRNRYKTDEEYRRKVLDRNQARREKRKAEEEVDLRAREEARKAEPSEAWMEYEDADGQVWLTIGALARALGKSVKTLRLWETKGWIPPAACRTYKGERIYTPEQILDLRAQLLKEGRISDAASQPKPHSYVKILKVKDECRPSVVFRVSALALATNRSVSIILQHESNGRFPATPLRAPGGQRLYTSEMIEAAVQAYTWLDTQPRPKPWKEFYSRVQEVWSGLGLDDAVVLDPVAPKNNGKGDTDG